MREGLLVAGKYKLLKLIGTGGMGSVWLSRNEMTEREFAIKFLHPSAAANPKVLTRFMQEAKVSGRLRCSSILEIFDVGIAPELDGAPFLVMELLEGAPLDVVIRLLGGLPLRMTLQIALAMARALAIAHDKGVIHRDIKPANVFLHRTNSGGLLPKLLDFGISKLARDVNTSDSSSMGLTQTGAVLGSPLYMSPEQAAGDKHVDGRSDIHALGVMMWWCLAGRSPFKSTTYNTLVVEIITGERPNINDLMPELPPRIGEIISKCYARRREERYENMTVLGNLLEEELAKLGSGPTLESREWVDEIFAKLRITQSGQTSGHQAAHEPKEASTTGAVSVSIDDILPDDSRSPAAYTVDSRSAIALAPTEASDPSRPRAPMLSTTAAARSAFTTKRSTIAIAWIGAGIFAISALAVGAGVLLRSSKTADAPSGSAAALTAIPTSPAPALSSNASSASSAASAASAATSVPAMYAPSAVDSGAPVATPIPQASAPEKKGGAGRANPPIPQPRGGKPPTTAPATTAEKPDPFHGVD